MEKVLKVGRHSADLILIYENYEVCKYEVVATRVLLLIKK